MVDSKSAIRVTVHSTLTVVSSRPVEPGVTRRLSPFDHAMRPHSCHVVFYYKNNPLGSFELDPLRVSLSEVLSIYPLSTGRLKQVGKDGRDWEVRCNDAGVRVVRAKVRGSLDEWMRSADGTEEKDLTVWEDLPDEPHIWSPFRIQLNEFEGGGIAIGISCTHMIADLTSIALLFKSWTDVYRKRPVEFPPLFSVSPVSFPLAPNTCKQCGHSESSWVSSPPEVSIATFKFSDQAIRLSMEGLRGDIPGVSPFDFLAAIFWTGIIRIKSRTGRVRDHVMSIAMDCRKLVKNLQPLSYFGNAVHFSALQANYADLMGDLCETVKLVHDHVSRVTEKVIQAGLNGLYQETDPRGLLETPTKTYGGELTCVNMEHMVVKDKTQDVSIMYKAAFNDGETPLHVSCHVGNAGGEGLIIIVPEEGLARSVHISLPEEEMAELLRDKAISELDPTLLLSAGK